MARNEEKAQSMLNRFLQGKEDALKGPKERRPYLASLCETLQEAERWRHQILGEVAKKVSMIQNTSLGEFRIRDLNDEINKVLREKGHWERRIIELGGPNYFAVSRRLVDESGAATTGSGYKYFGAARELPGVKELLREDAPKPPKRTRFEMLKSVDPDYYGYRDEDDGILLAAESAAEATALHAARGQWEASQAAKRAELEAAGIDATAVMQDRDQDLGLVEVQQIDAVRSHVQLPSQSNIEKLVLERKKKEMLALYTSDAVDDLMSRYASEEMIQQGEATKGLMGGT